MIPFYVLKYIRLSWCSGASGNTIDLDTTRESSVMQQKKKW